jgi:hypothetical protein
LGPSKPELNDASSAVSPVEMQLPSFPSRSCRALAADTVGRRSWRVSLVLLFPKVQNRKIEVSELNN